MDKLYSATNLKTAGAVTIAMLLASNFTAGKGTLIQGGAMFVAAAATVAFVVPKL